ncbi:MAG: type III-B CRISPR-associated protein Cas10/Cmr2 [Calditrichaeota bacterium]|nr:type III-B CRISPR-associated protein Cas10/Cmr2 [Calditrichota bacterium]
MKDAIIQQKIKAYLHDPIHKALILMQMDKTHEEVAQELASIVGISLSEVHDVDLADQLASAADRFIFPGDREFMAKFLEQPILTHPFSGVQKDFTEQLKTYSANELISETEKAIRRTLETYQNYLNELSSNKEKNALLYWLLWRRYNEDVQKQLTTPSLKAIWPFLPADTRIPDHSLWNHLKVTAALSACVAERGNVNKQDWIDAAFLLFSIGPVQSFISTARKTIDHWMGSFLLSYLTFTAMQAVFEEIGADAIIFPELYGQPFMDAYLFNRYPEIFEEYQPNREQLLTPSLPNRFLAIVPTGLAEELARNAEKAVKKEWGNIWNAGKHYFEERIGIQQTKYWNHLWERQCTDYFEIYWLVLPWKKSFQEQSEFYRRFISSESPVELKEPKIWEKVQKFYNLKLYEHPSNLALAYPLIYELAEHLFGARKNLRYYQPSLNRGEPSFKCHLCGEREVLHVEEPKIPGYFQQFDGIITHQKDGEKFYRGKDGWQHIQTFWKELILGKIDEKPQAKIRKFFKENERLCAVCASKRVAEFYLQKQFQSMNISVPEVAFNYPSTAEIAGLPFKEQILHQAEDAPGVLDDFLEKLKGLQENAAEEKFYFQTFAVPALMKRTANKPSLQDFAKIDSSFLLNLLNQETGDEVQDDLDKGTNVLTEIRESFRKLTEVLQVSPSRLSRYYCYLAMDGDKMGEWVAGKRLPQFQEVIHPKIVEQIKNATEERTKKIAHILTERRRITPSIHSMISSVQNQFAVTVARQVVEEQHRGKLVYAGGDDVLAMVPVADALSLAHHLRLAFSGYTEQIEKAAGWVAEKDGWQMRFGHTATASLGLVIAHHTTPMRQVIAQAQKMEKKAKAFGRNALGIALLKRSGEIVQTIVPFHPEKETTPDFVNDVLIPMYNWIVNDVVSRDWVYVLKAEQLGFSDDQWEMFAIEIRRVFERKIKKKDKKKDLLKELDVWLNVLQQLSNELRDRLAKLETKEQSAQNSHNRIIREILNMFAIVEFMARES